MITCKSTKLSTKKFPVKNKFFVIIFYKIYFKNNNKVVCHSKYPNKWWKDYIGETNSRIVERMKDHNIRYKNSHLLEHPREKSHVHV